MQAEYPDSKRLSQIAVDALDDFKGQSIRNIEVSVLTEITDYMVIATGRSSTHVKALSDQVVKKIREAGGRVTGVEGRTHAEWVLVDAGDVVVHVMQASVRALYQLEDLWGFQVVPDQEQEPTPEKQPIKRIQGQSQNS